MTSLEAKAKAFKRDVELRRHAYRSRQTSEGLWRRVAVAVALAGPEGLYKTTDAPAGATRIGSLSSLSGCSLEIYVAETRQEGWVSVTPRQVFQVLSSPPRERQENIVCVIPKVDPARARLSDMARIMGCRGGKSRSSRKAAASRRNGRKGGRPGAGQASSGSS